MSTGDENDIDIITELAALHKQQIMDGKSYEDNMAEIVLILGGIDAILSNYLSKTKDLSLDTSQIDKIKQIIDPNASSQCRTIKDVETMQTFHDFAYNFYDSDRLSMRILSVDIAQKIDFILHSWITSLIVMILCIPWVVTTFLFGPYSIPTVIVYCCNFLFFIEYQIGWTLEINTEAFKMVVLSFDFWVKMVYCVSSQIFSAIRDRHVEDSFNTIPVVLGSIIWCFVIFCVASFDALNVKIRMKVFISMSTATWFSYLCIISFFSRDDYVIPFVYGYDISCNELIFNSTSFLSIFLWQQSFYSVYYKNQCTTISYSPYIRWYGIDHIKTIKHGMVSMINISKLKDDE